MPPRRRRSEARPRPWALYALFALGVFGGVVLWAYRPNLPKELLIQRYASAQSQFIDVGGVRAHVRDEGKPDGMPLVMIHGSLGSLQVWEGWVRELKDRLRLISVDLPGHGLTGPWPRGDYTVEAYSDFIEVLADALHLDRFAIAGQSMGGAVAWSFAATRPERVTHLILVDSSGFRDSSGTALSSKLAHLGVLSDIGIYFKPESIMRRALLETYADPAMVTPARLQRYSDLQRFPGNRPATLQRLRTQEPLDPTTLRHLDVPTLIIWGAKDQQLPVNDAYRFQSDIKGAKLAIFSRLGHAPMEEDPKATAAAVATFLPKDPPPPPAPPAEAPRPSADQPVAPSIVPEKD
jgi:pimeloyl-ACP methyl ester carboxylesterase